MSKKLVSRESLQFVMDELFIIKLHSSSTVNDRIEKLIKYIEDNIIQKDKEMINEMKRTIHKKRKESKTPEENLYWNELYKSVNELINEL